MRQPHALTRTGFEQQFMSGDGLVHNVRDGCGALQNRFKALDPIGARRGHGNLFELLRAKRQNDIQFPPGLKHRFGDQNVGSAGQGPVGHPYKVLFEERVDVLPGACVHRQDRYPAICRCRAPSVRCR